VLTLVLCELSLFFVLPNLSTVWLQKYLEPWLHLFLEPDGTQVPEERARAETVFRTNKLSKHLNLLFVTSTYISRRLDGKGVAAKSNY